MALATAGNPPRPREFIKTIIYAGLIAVGIHTFLFEPFFIPSGSMVPTLLVGDYLFVNKFAYGYSHFSLPFSPDLFSGRISARMPKRGDVVVFRLPGDAGHRLHQARHRPAGRHHPGAPTASSTSTASRCRGRMSATTSMTAPAARWWRANNRDAAGRQEPCRSSRKPTRATPTTPRFITVPPGDLFMMGDNRDDSEDSRFMDGPVGYVPVENVRRPGRS